ncbi:MAG TPA: glycosyltransferase family 4 protein [Devosia sp.]|nr:glycosyltransferase family 4 protein [Devosia sp.]
MTRVLQLVSRDEPGGVQVLTRMIGDGLAARGSTVTTLALAVEGGLPARLAQLGRVMGALLFGRYDAVLSYQAAAGIMAATLGWAGRIPLRAVHQTAMPHAVRPHWRWLDCCCGTLGLHSHIIANSHATAKAFAAYPAPYRSRIHVILHGVSPLPAPKFVFDWRATLFIPEAAPLLVSTGRLMPQKNHLTAIAALAALPRAHLIIAGEGDDRAELLAAALAANVAGRLHLIGDRPREAVASLLAAGDVYVFPSVWETFGLAVVEAGMTGLPIVAADLSVLREVLQPAAERGMALFHPPKDAVALASCLTAMLANAPDAATRTASARAVTERHGLMPMLDAYERLLAGASRASR